MSRPAPRRRKDTQVFEASQFSLADFYIGDSYDPLRPPEDFARWLDGGAGWRDGETYEHMGERVLGAIADIVGEHPDGRVLVVTHGGPIRAVHAAALGMDLHEYRRLRPVEPNARLSAVCTENGRLTRLCPANEIPDLLAEEERRRDEAAAQPPTPAG